MSTNTDIPMRATAQDTPREHAPESRTGRRRLAAIIAAAAVAAGVLLLPGCGVSSYFSNDRVAVVSYDQAALRGIQQGRAYASQGRLELAKEQYLTALASATDESTRSIATHELQAVDQMIQAQR